MGYWQLVGRKLLLILRDNKGQGLAEYALILVLIALVVFAMVRTMGGELNNTYTRINSEVQNAGK